MITINNLSFSYGANAVLKNISMELLPGRIYGLLGENGVGKTTLLTLLCGLKKPQTGSIDIDGFKPFDRKPELLSEIYYLSDEVMDITMKPADFARNYGKFWNGFSMDTFTRLLELFEVPVDNRMDRMSAGQLKKTHISFALACSCRYIFMDEPTNGLDIPSKAQFRKALMQFTSDDSTVVISTHQVRDIDKLLDHIIVMFNHKLLLNEPIREISRRLAFVESNDAELVEKALYCQSSVAGKSLVLPNDNDDDSEVNLETLFNLAIEKPEVITQLFNHKNA